MKIKVLHRDTQQYEKPLEAEAMQRMYRNPDPDLHPFERAREYVRALNAVKLQKIFSKPLVGVLDGHTDSVKCMTRCNTNVSWLFTGSCDGEVRQWNLKSRECVRMIKAHDGFVRGATTSYGDEEKYLFTVGDDKRICQWSIEERQDIETLDQTELEDGGNLVPLGDANTNPLKKNVKPINVMQCQSTPTAIDHHRSRPHIVVSGETVDVWDHTRSMPIASYEWGVGSHVDGVYTVRVNPSEHSLIAATATDNTIGLYDMRGNSAIRKLQMSVRCNSVCWNPMRPLSFTAGSDDGNCYTFDVRNLEEPRRIHKDFVGPVLDVDYCPTGTEFVAAGYDSTIRLFDVGAGRSKDVYHGKRMHQVLCCRFSADSRFVLSGSADMCVRIWKAKASEALGPRHYRERQALAYRSVLVDKYKHMKEVGRIARHHHVPKLVLSKTLQKKEMTDARKRKDMNVMLHSKPGSSVKKTEKKLKVKRVIR
eukprot:GHVN01093907.1.p1 GENE.GHVN01093907.1~~GHVN01093907.1.p1  ORF type:complete len:479 (-),score=77.61 GHVN01093907.1:1768-3204(-)